MIFACINRYNRIYIMITMNKENVMVTVDRLMVYLRYNSELSSEESNVELNTYGCRADSVYP